MASAFLVRINCNTVITYGVIDITKMLLLCTILSSSRLQNYVAYLSMLPLINIQEHQPSGTHHQVHYLSLLIISALEAFRSSAYYVTVMHVQSFSE